MKKFFVITNLNKDKNLEVTKKIKAYLVTNMEEQQESLFDVPVMEVDRVELIEDALVIVAVADRNLVDVLMKINSKGHENYILKNDEFYIKRDKEFQNITGIISIEQLTKLRQRNFFDDNFRKSISISFSAAPIIITTSYG